jgi:putative phosphoesterase
VYGLIGLLSDAHGNVRAFDRAVSLLLAEGAQHLFFLGDAIGYLPSSAVLDSIHRLGGHIACIRGNHEAMLLEERGETALEDIYQLEALRPALTQTHLQMIASWPVSQSEVISDQKVLLLHGSPSNPTFGYVYPDTELKYFFSEMDWVFMGNTHRPFIREYCGTTFVNIGSCGLPRDDGRYGSVALFDAEKKTVRILRFDISQESEIALREFKSIHHSVKDIFSRRSKKIVGEIV